jgi:PAS domain S-box-containing protein
MSQSNTSVRPTAGSRGVSRVLLESVREATLVVDAGLRIVMLNRAAEAFIGWSEAEAQGRLLADVCPLTPAAPATGEDVQDVPFRHWIALESAEALEGQARLAPREGSAREVSWRIARASAGGDDAEGFVITLRARASVNALLDTVGESEYRRRIVEAEPACVKVVAPDGTLVDMNAAGLAMIQAASLEEAQSQPLIEFIAPAHRASFSGLHRTVMAGATGTLQFEVVGRRGGVRWLETQAVPLRDADGRVAALLGVTHDISERKSAEQALKDSRSRYQTLLDVAPVGVFQTDARGATTYVNPHWCRLSGLQPDEALGDGWLRGVHPDDIERIRHGWRRATARRRADATEYRLVRPDGTVSWVLGHAIPELDADGRFTGYIGTITDVTARINAERVLEMQNQVLAMVATGAPLTDTLNTLLRLVEEQAPGMLSSVLLLDPDGVHLRVGAAPSLPEAYVRLCDGIVIGDNAGSCGTSAFLKRAVIVEDIATDPLWAHCAQYALPFNLRACWSTPIFDVHGAVLGTFGMYFREPRRPQESHERIAQLTIHLASLAIARHREESALRASESRLAAAQSRARLGSWEFDAESMSASWSAEMYRLFGRGIDGPVPTVEEILDLLHPADRGKAERALQEAIARRTPLTLELRSNPDLGAVRWFRSSIDPLFDENGRVVRFAGTTLDVTDTRRAEEELRRVNRDLLMLSRVNQALVRSDEEGELIEHFCRIVVETAGYGAASVVPLEGAASEGNRVSGSDATADLQALAADAAVAGAVVRRVMHERTALAIPLGAGSETWGALLILAPDDRDLDEAEVALVVELAADLAFGVHALRARKAHRLVQEELMRSERRFRATFEQAAVGVAHVSPEGRFIRVNRRLAEITGYAGEELVRRTLTEVTHPASLAADAAHRARLLSGELNTYDLEQRFIRKGGSVVETHITTSLVRREDGQPDYFIAVVQDITAKRNLEAQLRHSQKMEAIGLLAGGVAHEFNNVLSVILGNAELSLADSQAGAELGDSMHAIVEAANRGADITRQLLAFARKETSAPVVLDVNARVVSLSRMLSRLAGEDVSLETSLSADTWPIRLDPTQFDQVIVNLVTNARDAVQGVGAISLATRNVVIDASHRETSHELSPGEYVCVTVSDTGVGMDAKTQERIFQPFFTTKPQGKGTGLGLAVVLGITQQAGGHVSVESAAGKGASFRLLFPRSLEPLRTPATPRRKDSALTGTETILLVEDEAPLLALTRRSLESYGYHVIPAGSPGEALLQAEHHAGEIALLLTDVVMPTMNGRDLYERIVALRPGIRVVYMSGYPADIVARRGEIDAGTVYVQKPFVLASLAKSVRRALD